ncbi:hypothetical protein [Kineococcus rhizosphaerae]|nr:hypothetical protein [Kineococcus rhizosphaerae]
MSEALVALISVGATLLTTAGGRWISRKDREGPRALLRQDVDLWKDAPKSAKAPLERAIASQARRIAGPERELDGWADAGLLISRGFALVVAGLVLGIACLAATTWGGSIWGVLPSGAIWTSVRAQVEDAALTLRWFALAALIGGVLWVVLVGVASLVPAWEERREREEKAAREDFLLGWFGVGNPHWAPERKRQGSLDATVPEAARLIVALEMRQGGTLRKTGVSRNEGLNRLTRWPTELWDAWNAPVLAQSENLREIFLAEVRRAEQPPEPRRRGRRR